MDADPAPGPYYREVSKGDFSKNDTLSKQIVAAVVNVARKIGIGGLSVALVLAVAVGLMFFTSPRHEEFWWTDGASFALNGEMTRDYIASGLGQSPTSFAQAWFLRYPALTISLYPPIFPLAEAAVFAVFGFSHAAAQATVAAFTALAAFGAYRMARTAVAAPVALGFALAMLAAPDVMLWSRQVVMETPSLAFLLLGGVALLRYQAERRTRDIVVSALLVLTAACTKQTALFLAPAFAIALLVDEGPRLVRNRAAWLAGAIGLVGLLPLAIFTVLFAPLLIDIAIRQGAASASETSPMMYLLRLPGIAGWIPLAGALGYLALAAARGWTSLAERRLAVFMLSWFFSLYACVSMIGHFEERYGMALAIPPAMLSVLLVARMAGARWAAGAALCGGLAMFAVALATSQVPAVGGYGAVASAILNHSAQDDVVLMDLDNTKSLTLSLRTRSPTPKIYALRAEKMLVHYSIIREWGIRDRGMSEQEITDMIDREGISLVVFQPDFWTDQPSMARLQSIINSDRFQKIAEFKVAAGGSKKDISVQLFRNKSPVRHLGAPTKSAAARN